MSAARNKSNAGGGSTNQLLQVPEAADSNNQQRLKPKRKAPSRPSSAADKSKTGSSSSNQKANTKVKRKTSLQEVSSDSRNAKVKRRTSDTTNPIKEEGEDGSTLKAKRKVSPSPITEEGAGEDTKDNKLRRIVSPRKEQYSHLLDEMIGCGDMVLLEPLTEDNIIENLKKRYAAGDIYVRTNSLKTITIHILLLINVLWAKTCGIMTIILNSASCRKVMIT